VDESGEKWARSKAGFIKKIMTAKKDEIRDLRLVLKTDSAGTAEAIISGLNKLNNQGVGIDVIQKGVGNISKSDLLMAETGSRLVAGFEVDLLPRIKETASERGIEIRLHDVIYRFMDDIKEITLSLIPVEDEEKITGRAKVIDLFRGGHKGIILGCEVLDGVLAQGKRFRLISDPGIVYEGNIESLHIETRAVKQASVGQKVGLKIPRFERAKKGDLVEVFQVVPSGHRPWQPRGGVFDLRSGSN